MSAWKCTLACVVLFTFQAPLAFSQQAPILPEASTIPALARSVPIDSSRRQWPKITTSNEAGTAVNSRLLREGEPAALEVIDMDRSEAETYDTCTSDRYVTAQLLNVPGAYARFSVVADRIVGTPRCAVGDSVVPATRALADELRRGSDLRRHAQHFCTGLGGATVAGSQHALGAAAFVCSPPYTVLSPVVRNVSHCMPCGSAIQLFLLFA